MIEVFTRLIRSRRGVTAIEYGLILAFVCVVVIASISLVGGKTLTMWTNVNTKFPVVSG